MAHSAADRAPRRRNAIGRFMTTIRSVQPNPPISRSPSSLTSTIEAEHDCDRGRDEGGQQRVGDANGMGGGATGGRAGGPPCLHRTECAARSDVILGAEPGFLLARRSGQSTSGLISRRPETRTTYADPDGVSELLGPSSTDRRPVLQQRAAVTWPAATMNAAWSPCSSPTSSASPACRRPETPSRSRTSSIGASPSSRTTSPRSAVGSTRWWAMPSSPCSVRRSPTRTTPSGRCGLRCGCRRRLQRYDRREPASASRSAHRRQHRRGARRRHLGRRRLHGHG